MTHLRLILALAVLALVATTVPVAAQSEDDVPHLFVFSRTDGFRHDSIAHSWDVIEGMATDTGAFTVEFSEDTADLTDDLLDRTDVILFANTTGEHPFSDEQKTMFVEWLEAGGGFMGIHAAADTNYDWPAYQELVGAAFESHPHNGGLPFPFSNATVQVENADHPVHATTTVDSYSLKEEYYKWRVNPRDTQDVEVLLSLDETSTYTCCGPPSWGLLTPHYEDDQPLEWVKSFRGHNRVWYTNLGHYNETYDRPEWQARFLSALEWVAAGPEAVAAS